MKYIMMVDVLTEETVSHIAFEKGGSHGAWL